MDSRINASAYPTNEEPFSGFTGRIRQRGGDHMNAIQSKVQILIICSSFLVTGFAVAAGGVNIGGGGVGGYGNVGIEPVKRKTPRELAIQNYNQGLKLRDKAWTFMEKADQASNEKKRARLEKKADKRFKKAVKRYRTAIKHEPVFYQAHGSLGYALRHLGDYHNALLAYDESLRLKPDYSEAIEYRAEAYLALGSLAETRKAYVKLMNIDRPRADQLMEVIQGWLLQNHPGIDPAEKAEFDAWATERLTLSVQTYDLTGAAPRDWQLD